MIEQEIPTCQNKKKEKKERKTMTAGVGYSMVRLCKLGMWAVMAM